MQPAARDVLGEQPADDARDDREQRQEVDRRRVRRLVEGVARGGAEPAADEEDRGEPPVAALQVAFGHARIATGSGVRLHGEKVGHPGADL